jgi:hypothetical protein
MPGDWRQETSDLAPAMRAYIAGCCGQGPAPTEAQLERVIYYLNYYIHAPCWETSARMSDDGPIDQLLDLRRRAKSLASVESCRRWIEECLDIAIDPL